MTVSYDHLDKLLETARAGQMDELRLLIQETMCINEVHPITHELIVETLAREGGAEVVKYLLDLDASPRAACRGAAAGGHQALMKELLDQGVDEHFAVRGAARGGHTQLMWSLIRDTTTINAALWGASENGDSNVIELLLQKGARSAFVLFGAIASGDQARMRASMPYNQSTQALQIAAFYGQTGLLDELKSHCVDAQFLERVPCCLAEGGYETAFLKRYGENSEYLAWGIRGAAKGGHVKFLNTLIQHATQKALLNEKTALTWAAVGAAMSNHSKLVDDLIARGAPLEDALLGAAIGDRQVLMDRLIAEGTRLGLLRKEIAVRAAAISRRYDYMNNWLTEGASVNEAFRGVCFRGEDLELAKSLLSKGASPEWGLLGYYEGYREECYIHNQKFSDLLESFRADYFRASLTLVKQHGWSGTFLSLLERLRTDDRCCWQTILNVTLSGAARAGFRTNISTLVEMGANAVCAIEGAIATGDRHLLESLIPIRNPPSDSLETFFQTALTSGQEDLVQWMLQRLRKSCVDECALAIRRMGGRNEAVQALSLISDPNQQLQIANKAEVLDMIRPAQIMRRIKVSPHIARVSRQINGASLRYLSTLCFLNKPSIPKDAVKKLLSFVAASEGHQIPEREIPALMRASHFANTPEMKTDVTPPGSCCIL